MRSSFIVFFLNIIFITISALQYLAKNPDQLKVLRLAYLRKYTQFVLSGEIDLTDDTRLRHQITWSNLNLTDFTKLRCLIVQHPNVIKIEQLISLLNSPSARWLKKLDVSLKPLERREENYQLSNLVWSSFAHNLNHLELEMRKSEPRASINFAWIVSKIGLAADRLEFLRIYDNDCYNAKVNSVNYYF